MYYQTRAIRVKKNGKVSVTAADSNVRPLRYFTSEYRGTLGELLASIYEGNFHLANNQGLYVYNKFMNAISDLMMLFDKSGLDWETCYRYGIQERRDGLQVICDAYAERIITNDFSDPQGFGQALGEKLDKIILLGQNSLLEKKQQDKDENITRIQCAAYSIFNGLVLLETINNEWILAPEKDYGGNGILQTMDNNIIHLNANTANIYPYLSFTGVNLSRADILSKFSDRATTEKKLDDVDKIVSDVLATGAEFRGDARPYIDYKEVAA